MPNIQSNSKSYWLCLKNIYRTFPVLPTCPPTSLLKAIIPSQPNLCNSPWQSVFTFVFWGTLLDSERGDVRCSEWIIFHILQTRTWYTKSLTVSDGAKTCPRLWYLSPCSPHPWQQNLLKDYVTGLQWHNYRGRTRSRTRLSALPIQVLHHSYK